jgi:hypothetical protein
MPTVDVTMASRPLLKVGKYHLAALKQTAETKGLAIAFTPTVNALATAKTAREQAEDALIEPRATARFAEAGLEVVIHEIASQAHSSDRKAGGDLVFKAIFPNGLDAEIRPRGAAQLTASTALRGRLDSQPAAAPVKAQCLKDLDTAMAALGGALESRRMAEQALGLARAAEDGARETFVSSYDSNAGAIRQMFPRNHARQDLYFDQIRAGQSSGGDDNNGHDPAPPSPDPKKA